MKKSILAILLSAALGLSATACSGNEPVELDLQLCADNTITYFTDEANGFPKMDISVNAPDEANNFFNVIIVTDEKLSESSEYVTLMKECLNTINHQAVLQDPKLKEADDDTYGGLFEKYDVKVTATSLDEILSLWTIDQTIPAGSNAPLEINTEKIDLSALAK